MTRENQSPPVNIDHGSRISCAICHGAEWVCENHPDRPWDGVSDREDACGCGAGAPCSCTTPSALNISAGLFLDSDGSLYPVTNWFDDEGDECPREDAQVCVAGMGGCWFALRIADFSEKGASA